MALSSIFGLLWFARPAHAQTLSDAQAAASPIVSTSNGYLVLQYYQLKDTPFLYLFQTSTSLYNWTTQNNQPTPTTIDVGTAWLNTIEDTVPIGSTSQRFLRMEIVDPTQLTDLLLPPTNLSVSLPAGATNVALAWSDNSPIETGYAILRETGTAGSFQQIAMVGADITSYSDYTVQGSTTYTYEVAALNGPELSAYSNQATVTTLLDTNGDGIADIYKYLFGINADDGTDSVGGSGLPDGWLIEYGLDPFTTTDADVDLIGKGWTLADDYAAGTNPNMVDTDGDGVPDCQDEYPLDSRRSQDVSAPPTAALGVSAGIATGNVTKVAMDDSGDASFGFVSGTDGNGYPTSYKTYLFESGSATLAQTVALEVSGSIRTVVATDASGLVYGWDETIPWGATYQAQGGNVGDIAPPDPPYSDFTVAPAIGGFENGPPSLFLEGVANNGVYYGEYFGVVASGSNPFVAGSGSYNTVLVNNGQSVVFDPTLVYDTGADIPSDITPVDSHFEISQVSGSGTAIGNAADNFVSGFSGPAYWDGQQLDQLPGLANSLNDAGEVVGTVGTDGTSAYLWRNVLSGSGSTTLIQTLIPPVYQTQIKNIHPALISSPNPHNRNATHIIFSAQSLEGAGTGSWQYEYFDLTYYPPSTSGSTPANTLTRIQENGAPVAASWDGILLAQAYDSTTSLTQAYATAPAQFKLRDDTDVTNGPWDSTDPGGIKNAPPTPAPWTSVIVDGTNSLTRLVCPITVGMELAVNPGMAGSITLGSGTTLAVTGTSTNIDIVGVIKGPAQILLRQKSTQLVSGTLNVDVLTPQTVPIDIFQVSDSNNAANTAVPSGGITPQEIVDDLNEGFAQAGVTFELGQTGALSPAGWSDTNGNLVFVSATDSPVTIIEAAAPSNQHLKMFIVKHIGGTNPNGDTLGETFEGEGPCFVDWNAPTLAFNHEVGHALGIATQNFDGKSHDDGPWPFEFRFDDLPLPQQGLMYPIVTNITGWIRKADWDNANTTAQRYK